MLPPPLSNTTTPLMAALLGLRAAVPAGRDATIWGHSQC
jgi:hypothetical protein